MNKYEVIDIVGEGAYGVVLKCKNKETRDFVAIKKFKESEDDEAVRRTTIRELKVLRQLKHANIVNLIEAFRRRGKLYLVFEYVSCNMLELLDGHPHGVASKMVMSLTYQLLKALHWCHSHQVIHRDIKPENLLISEKNELKLCDFGFARALTQNNGGARYTEYVATRWYRSPELLVGVPYGPGVDIWSAACIMGELADGRAVFPGESDIDQLYTIQKILGPLPENLRRAFFVNPRYRGVKFPNDMPKTSSLALSFKKCKNMTKAGIELLSQMLEMSPSDRPTSVACLAHRAFSGFRVVEAVAKMPDSGIPATSTSTSTSQSSVRPSGTGTKTAPAGAIAAAAAAAVKTAVHPGAAAPGGGSSSSSSSSMSTRRKSAKRRQDRSPHTDDSDGGGGNRVGSGTGNRGQRQQPLLTQTLPVARGTSSDDAARGGLGSSTGKERSRPFLIVPSQASLRSSSSSTGHSSEAHPSELSSGWRTRSKRRVHSTSSLTSTLSSSSTAATAASSQNQSDPASRASNTGSNGSNGTPTTAATTSTAAAAATASLRSMKSMELPQKPLRGAYGAGPASNSMSLDSSWLNKSGRHPAVSIGPTHTSQHPPRSLSSEYKAKAASNSPKLKSREHSLSRKPTYGSWEPPKRSGGSKAKGLPQLRGMPGGTDVGGGSIRGGGGGGGGGGGSRQKSWSGVTTL